MATIREKAPGQWHVQVRRTGWPQVTATLPNKKQAEAWARDVEGQMAEKRPSLTSRVAEKLRLERFLREEPQLDDAARLFPACDPIHEVDPPEILDNIHVPTGAERIAVPSQ